MDITLAIVALICSFVGILGCIVPVLPGLLLNYIALLCLYFTSYGEVDILSLVIWLVVILLASVLDYVLPAYMTRQFGGTKAGAWGATIGVFVGLFLFPPYGILFGPFCGAVLGELTQNKKDAAKAFKSGFGSFLAFIVGTGVKLFIAFWLTVVVILTCWQPLWNWVVSLFR